MAKYLIHAYPKRMWYVEDFLVPSMLDQGIDIDDIIVYNDSKREGNLKACMNAFMCVDNDDKGTWHIQDDVLLCKNFKRLTELYDDGFVAGFSSYYDGPGRIGAVPIDKMWFSFPCIRIPNQAARGCSEWVRKYIIGNPSYRQFWVNGVNDDWAFRSYIKEYYNNSLALNIAPNLVNHVDYLLGGGSGQAKREKPCVAQYWWDDDLVYQLEARIKVWQKEKLRSGLQ